MSLLLALIYLSFVGLGLPDSLLGAAWPDIYVQLGVPLAWAGGLSLIISAGTIISSLLSDRLTRRFGAGLVTAVSVFATAVALLGFSKSGRYWQLCLFAVPYGLGAGGVDAALNNFAAVNYSSRHMNWLHCMWGLGASLGPWLMGYALASPRGWQGGYSALAWVQLGLSLLLFLSLPLWKGRGRHEGAGDKGGSAGISGALKLPGAWQIMLCFFCYCGLEQTAGLWVSTYLVLKNGLSPQEAAGRAGLYFVGITFGRALSGFLSSRLSDRALVRLGMLIMVTALALMPVGPTAGLAGLLLLGLGSAPVYPCLIHSTPAIFGPANSQAMIGLQMASAYMGTCLLPPLFGLLAQNLSAVLFPAYMLLLLTLLYLSHEGLRRKGSLPEGGYGVAD